MLESYGTFVVRHQQVYNFDQISEAETAVWLATSSSSAKEITDLSHVLLFLRVV